MAATEAVSGWYPDPAGSGGMSYWNGYAWGGEPPRPPTNNRGWIIGGGVALCFLMLALIGNCSGPSDNSSTTTLTSTVTRTVGPPTATVSAQPPIATITETAPPSTVTETAQAAAPSPWTESTPVYAPPLVDVPESASSVYYSNCSEARAAGAAPLYTGAPGYRSGLDRDNDGVACE
ncbi:excalibur calcium-binding domain-containing protein [Mycolicibacterium tusciae]|uniref:excalibur calcium-binding domain-containing protein n=1 Tax=Mycolicibacterium tusciae TaxID=75922 RepID=UPI0002E9A533|nr:excalibur calcium-binding domain-containing protein [Mycolicibacterium tusciae]